MIDLSELDHLVRVADGLQPLPIEPIISAEMFEAGFQVLGSYGRVDGPLGGMDKLIVVRIYRAMASVARQSSNDVATAPS